MMEAEQKTDMVSIFGAKWKNLGNMDYVSCWYKKAFDYMAASPATRTALVSTNSVAQGQAVASLLGPLMAQGLCIDFAHRTRPLCDVPAMDFGNMPNDGGNLLLTPEEREAVLREEPALAAVIRPFVGAVEFINRKCRYCFWLVGASPAFLRASPILRARVEAVRELRLASTASAMVKKADTSLSVKQIASAVCDPSPAHFATAFRARYGMSPLAWRRVSHP